jgi:hypothetical protein
MSKFIDELKRVSQVGLQPMGFKAAILSYCSRTKEYSEGR